MVVLEAPLPPDPVRWLEIPIQGGSFQILASLTVNPKPLNPKL